MQIKQKYRDIFWNCPHHGNVIHSSAYREFANISTGEKKWRDDVSICTDGKPGEVVQLNDTSIITC